MEFLKHLMNLQRTTTPGEVLILSILLSSILPLLIIIIRNVKSGRGKNFPPGSLGLPVIGQTLQFVRARKCNKSKEWIQEKVAKYGPVFKTSLLGCPTVVLTGQEGNKFLLQNDYNMVINKRPIRVSRVLGNKNLFELPVEDHKRMRAAIMQFMRPEALQKFVGRMESVIVQHFSDCWQGEQSITVWPLMKKLTFQVACDTLFSLKDSEEREILAREFATALKGIYSLPLDFPGTTYRRSLKARSRICKRLSLLLEERRGKIKQGLASPSQDLMSCMLTMKDENGESLTEEEIIDNMMLVMIAGHETTSVLLTHLMRMLALHPNVYQKVLQEHTEVLAGKPPNEPLKWEEIQKMKYTWKVAQETLRLVPPAFGSFRKAIKDVEYGGYTIPKGWQFFWVTSTHWSEEIFKDSSKFDPSHFDQCLPPYSFIAFGGGPRICPGYDFSKMETIIFVHHLISKYKWSLIHEDEKIVAEPLPVPCLGLPIKLQAKTL
uniref:CYP728Q11 n=2 Tax=Taxus chinensis TaxID=29808 RepID=A0A291FAW4_TAXCH|nr:CYP728Q11 [Taxus chinensis]